MGGILEAKAREILVERDDRPDSFLRVDQRYFARLRRLRTRDMRLRVEAEWVFQALHEQGFSPKEIQGLLGYSRQGVWKMRKRLGIPTPVSNANERVWNFPESVWTAMQRCSEGTEDVTKIGDEVGWLNSSTQTYFRTYRIDHPAFPMLWTAFDNYEHLGGLSWQERSALRLVGRDYKPTNVEKRKMKYNGLSLGRKSKVGMEHAAAALGVSEDVAFRYAVENPFVCADGLDMVDARGMLALHFVHAVRDEGEALPLEKVCAVLGVNDANLLARRSKFERPISRERFYELADLFTQDFTGLYGR